MDHVQPLLQKAAEIIHIFGDVHLRGAGVSSIFDAVIEHVKGHALPQIVQVFLAIYKIVEADVLDIPLLKMLLAQVGGGAAAKNIIGHNHFPFEQHMFWAACAPARIQFIPASGQKASYCPFYPVYDMKSRQ